MSYVSSTTPKKPIYPTPVDVGSLLIWLMNELNCIEQTATYLFTDSTD